MLTPNPYLPPFSLEHNKIVRQFHIVKLVFMVDCHIVGFCNFHQHLQKKIAVDGVCWVEIRFLLYRTIGVMEEVAVHGCGSI